MVAPYRHTHHVPPHPKSAILFYSVRPATYSREFGFVDAKKILQFIKDRTLVYDPTIFPSTTFPLFWLSFRSKGINLGILRTLESLHQDIYYILVQ